MGLMSVSEIEPDITIVAQAEDGEEAVQLFRQHRPDVVIMDLRLPGMDQLYSGTASKRPSLSSNASARIFAPRAVAARAAPGASAMVASMATMTPLSRNLIRRPTVLTPCGLLEDELMTDGLAGRGFPTEHPQPRNVHLTYPNRWVDSSREHPAPVSGSVDRIWRYAQKSNWPAMATCAQLNRLVWLSHSRAAPVSAMASPFAAGVCAQTRRVSLIRS